jgi:flagellar motor protein MotB
MRVVMVSVANAATAVTGFAGAADTKPDGSDDPVGRQKNRRVELTLRSG